MTQSRSTRQLKESSATASDESYECVVIGGGPAGAALATMLADYGHSVLVLEKASFPRHHIGESLMPHTYWTFKRIGMLDKMKSSRFPRKQSVQFIAASGKESQPFYFPDHDPNEWSITWQVSRPQFDAMMLDNARQHGAKVIEGASVREVLFDGRRAVGVRAAVGGSQAVIRAAVVADASGQSAVLSRQLKLRRAEEGLKNAAIYAYFRGARRDRGRDEGATIIIHTRDRQGWFWLIPLPDDVASVGIVASPAHLCAGRGDDPLATLEEEIAGCAAIQARLIGAERISGAYVTSDFSYSARSVAGDGWVLVGDAFGFLDPIYSSGVMLALKSAEFAADAIHEGLTSADLSGDRLGAFAPQFAGGMQRIRQLVYAFYDRQFSFREFLQSHPGCHGPLVRVLTGDVFAGGLDQLFDIMSRYVQLPAAMELEGTSRPAGAAGRMSPSR